MIINMEEKKVKEAIEYLSGYIQSNINLMEKIEGIVWIGEEPCKIAIEALEKQLQQKVEYEGEFSNNGFTRYRMAKCPDCDRWHSSRDEIIYCSKCGQRLDWSE